MSTQLKLRRGTTAQHSTFTGAEGEVTVDTTKDTLVVHDGTTAGGVPLSKAADTVNLTGAQTIAGVKTFSSDAVIQGLTVGRGAGAVATNTAVGASALAANTSGDTNTATGYQALTTNTSGTSNTAVGYQASYLNTTASYNASFGFQAGYAHTTGANNTALGASSLSNSSTGSNNVAVGFAALAFNTTASNNTAVGYQAGYSNVGGTGCVYVGYQAGYANVQTGGTNNTFIGTGAGSAVTTGYAHSILGNYNGNQGGLDIRTASNNIVLSDGSGNPRMFFDGNGNPSFQTAYSHTTASAANAFIRSDGYLMRSTSALKYKQDIRDLEGMDISALRPVRYKSNCEGDDQTKDHLGLIADEAADNGFEELISRGADGEVEGFQYERLTVVLLKELQILRARVAQLESNP